MKTGSVDDIKNTIIDGSNPNNPDSASCVFFSSGEDSTAVIEGFTLTKGKGTRYLYPNGWFREGGGVFVNKAAPTIKHNLIIGNEVLNTANVNSAGGGGIRSNLGNPHIYNNVITQNKALFGAAIVLDLSNGSVKNNIIFQNTGASVYGGGGAFWVYGPNCAVVIENNTITANSMGGMFFQAIKVSIINNIIWGNIGFQINYDNGFGNTELTVTNNVIQGDYANNLSSYPLFRETAFLLEPSSPAIDAGVDDELYNDFENALNPGNALSPSQGKTRNDIGAYGGSGATNLPSFEFSNLYVKSVSFGFGNTIGKPVSLKLPMFNQSTLTVTIDSIKKSANSQVILKSVTSGILKPVATDTIIVEWTPINNEEYKDSLLIYHSLNTIANPLKVYMSGKTKKRTAIKDIAVSSSINIYPNPIKETAEIQFKGVIPNSHFDIFDLNGRIIKSVIIDHAEGHLTFSRNEMSSGIYIYVLKSDYSAIAGKFAVE